MTSSTAGSLAHLLALWRAAPNRELADAIVEVGTSDDVTAALEQVLAKGSVKAREHLELLAERPPDPRIDRWVAAQYADPPTTSTGARPFWTRLLPLARRIADAQAAELILTTRETWRADVPWQAFLAGHIDRIRDTLAAVRDHAFADGTRDTIDSIRAELHTSREAARPARHADASDLLAAVLEHPDDDAARIVLGDVLLEQGDPRGELIALQVSRTALTAAEQKRERALVKQHARHLLGPLADVLRESTFARGFLSRAVVKAGNARALASAIEKVVGHPLWATVEHLEGGSHELALHPVMRSLRSLAYSGARLRDVSQLQRLEAYATRSATDWTTLDATAFPSLRALDVFLPRDLARQLLGSPLVARLERLHLRVELPTWTTDGHDVAFGFLRTLAALPARDVTLHLVRHRANDWGSAYRLVRGDDGKFAITMSTTRMNAAHEPLVRGDLLRALDILEALPRSSIVLDHRLADAAEVEARIAPGEAL